MVDPERLIGEAFLRRVYLTGKAEQEMQRQSRKAGRKESRRNAEKCRRGEPTVCVEEASDWDRRITVRSESAGL
jgi:hypothetical protein